MRVFNIIVIPALGRLFIFLLHFVNAFHESENHIELFHSLNDIPLDENDRVLDHWLLYLDNKECNSNILAALYRTNPDLRRVAKLSFPIISEFFTDESNEESNCSIVFLERGADFKNIIHVLPEDKLIINSETSDDLIDEYIRDHQKVEVGFASHYPQDLQIYWIDEAQHEKIKLGLLKKGLKNTVWKQSYLGHKFDLIDENTGEVVEHVDVNFNAFLTFGEQSRKSQVFNHSR